MDHRTLHPDRGILPFKTTGLRFPVSSANSRPVSTHPTKLMASSSLASLGCARRGVSEVVAIERRLPSREDMLLLLRGVGDNNKLDDDEIGLWN